MRWSAAHLKLSLDETDGVAHLELPEDDREAFGGAAEISLRMGSDAASGEPIDGDSRFGRWLIARLKASGPTLHARPCGQPLSVNDIMARMFTAYEVDGGTTHLAGCELTDHPFLRLTFAASEKDRVNHVFVAPDGSTVNDEVVRSLGLDQVEPITESPPRLDETGLRSLVAAGRRIAAKQASQRNPVATVAEPLAITAVWIRHVDGRLQFTIGDATSTHDFSGWAKLLVPQPFTARSSGVKTFRLSATDDGRIDATDEIAVCQQSGRRVLRQDLVTCSVTGQQVLPEFTETCAVTGLPTLRAEFAKCPHCRQRVSKGALEPSGGGYGRCQACRQLTRIRKDDPRLVWVLGEHPGLDQWNRWQLAETETVYITQAASLTKRLLAVVDKETLAIRYLATGGLINTGWAEQTGEDRDELLR